MKLPTMMKRVLVVGTSGSGKSTVARMIAERIGLPHYATDPFYWEQGWRPAPADQVNAQIDAVLAEPAWVLDGNFEDRWQDIWNRADLIVWLDYSLPRVLWQVATRNIRWWLSRQSVWSCGPMTLGRALSGIRHSLKSHARKRNAYPQYIGALRHDKVVRLSTRRETAAWLESNLAKPCQNP